MHTVYNRPKCCKIKMHVHMLKLQKNAFRLSLAYLVTNSVTMSLTLTVSARVIMLMHKSALVYCYKQVSLASATN